MCCFGLSRFRLGVLSRPMWNLLITLMFSPLLHVSLSPMMVMAMVMRLCWRLLNQAVSFLNERNGVSLSSIRKWILDKHPETKEKQKASFNSLTIKVHCEFYLVCLYTGVQ